MGTKGQGALWGSQAGWRPPGSPPHVLSQEVRDTGEKTDLDRVLKQPQEPVVAAGAQNLGSPRHGFMKCLLEVEEEATHQRATKAWALPNRKAPRTLMPVSTSAQACL